MPAAQHRVEHVIERSRFVCTLAAAASPVDAHAFIRAISAEHEGATHNCWAYVSGPPGSTHQIGLSDDGEPHGTAGRPMLTVLLHSGIGDIVAVVTRYYGGIKLGTGGLARAYGGAVQDALASLPTTRRIHAVKVGVVVDYASIDAVQQLLPSLDVVVRAEDYGADVTYSLNVPRSRVDELVTRLADITRGQARVTRDDAPE